MGSSIGQQAGLGRAGISVSCGQQTVSAGQQLTTKFFGQHTFAAGQHP